MIPQNAMIDPFFVYRSKVLQNPNVGLFFFQTMVLGFMLVLLLNFHIDAVG